MPTLHLFARGVTPESIDRGTYGPTLCGRSVPHHVWRHKSKDAHSYAAFHPVSYADTFHVCKTCYKIWSKRVGRLSLKED